MPDETESNASHASGGAYASGEKISKINVADEIKIRSSTIRCPSSFRAPCPTCATG